MSLSKTLTPQQALHADALRRRFRTWFTTYPTATVLADAMAALIVMETLDPDDRELLWRAWCRLTGASVTRTDLKRVREARTKHVHPSLF